MPRTERLDRVEPSVASGIRALWDAAEATDGVAPVSESFALALGADREGVAHLLRADVDGPLVGYAQVAGVGSGPAAAELVVDPAHRRSGHGRALLDAVLSEGAASVWAHGMLPAAAALARSGGWRLTRSLHRMSRPVRPGDATDPALPPGYSVRTFVPGQDDEEWVRLNGATFASHPEQGRLTVADLRERMAQPWFDAAGFLLVTDDTTGRVAAYHWTKVEPPPAPPRLRLSDRRDNAGSPAFSRDLTDQVGEVGEGGEGGGGGGGGSGEVYVVGVDPAHQGRGLGGPLTRLGLAHLARRGLTEVHLYVDGDNVAARRTYARLGFADVATDGQYSRPGT